MSVKAIKAKTTKFLADRKNANNLVDILLNYEETSEEVLLACIRASHKIFSALITEQEMYLAALPSEQDLKDLTPEEKYKLWLRERYADCQCHLLRLLPHDGAQVQELALCTLMKLVESEGNFPLKKIASKHIAFPIQFFQQVVYHLLSEDVLMTDLVTRFQEYLEYDDVRYYTMKHTLSHLKKERKMEDKSTYLVNVHAILENLSMPEEPEEGAPLSGFLCKLPETDSSIKMSTYREHKKLFTTLWLEFLKNKISTSLYKKVLVNLSDKVMPHMTSPLLLADFLTDSYNIGGAISLLALNGLFVLVHSFNLDYPDFYNKLYALLEPPVLHVKYRARFFFLTDLFLTSTHIPGYLVAAFTKKLARLALTAPPSGLVIIIPFIINLVNRHPTCKALLHRPDGPQDLAGDPFKMDELDPQKSNALESSLWELKTLQNHYYPGVASEARKINNPLQKHEIDLSDLLETTTDTLFKKETKKKMKTCPVTFDAPKGLFGNKEDVFKDIWVLE